MAWNFLVTSYAQIITLLQIAAQSNHLCEPIFNFYFLSRLAHCKASAIYTTPIALKPFSQSSTPKSFPHANIQLYFHSKYSSANLQSFRSARSFVKEVLAMHILMSWIFATSSICPYHSSPQNFSSLNLADFPQYFFPIFCLVESIMKEVPFLFIQMVSNS